MNSTTASSAVELTRGDEEPAVCTTRISRHLWIFEVLLVCYSLYSSVLYVYIALLEKESFSPAWDHGWTWIYFLNSCGGALATLGYIFHCRRGRLLRLTNKPEPLAKHDWSKTRRVFELVLLLWVAFGSDVLQNIYMLADGTSISDWSANLSSTDTVALSISQAGALLLLAYVLYVNHSTFADLGLGWRSWDWAMALPVLITAFISRSCFAPLIYWATDAVAGFEMARPDVWWYFLGNSIPTVSVFSNLVNGFYEELIVRAYLMTALERLCGSKAIAICASVVVQISYHFYQGTPAALSHVSWFIVFAIYYARTHRILPTIMAHTAYNSLGMISYASTLDTP